MVKLNEPQYCVELVVLTFKNSTTDTSRNINKKLNNHLTHFEWVEGIINLF